jgi:hypothetical protein
VLYTKHIFVGLDTLIAEKNQLMGNDQKTHFANITTDKIKKKKGTFLQSTPLTTCH